MSRVLDLNTVKRPTLDLTLQDVDRTTLRLTTPTEALVDELKGLKAEDLENLKTGDREAVENIYDLAARLISCNREFIKITGDELQGKYRMDLETAAIFFVAYLDFINEVGNQKN